VAHTSANGRLEYLGPGVFAWIQDGGDLAHPNAGVIIDGDGITLVDTLMVPSQTAPFGEAVDAFAQPIRRVVLTSSHLPYCGGTSRFRLAAIYGTPQISAHLDQPPNVAGYQHLLPEFADEFEDLTTRPVSHVVTEAVWLTPAAVAVPLAGQIRQNLVVQVPGANVVFGGALCAFGTTPLCFDGDPSAWADALDLVITYGAIVVPGQGPIGGADDVRALQAYLRACVAAEGDLARLEDGPWARWSNRRFDAVNVERAAQLAAGDPSPPQSILRLFGMA
jgi:glyoxylase-like metal-dependent hydrolase (beta-lactamase superfamily II)